MKILLIIFEVALTIYLVARLKEKESFYFCLSFFLWIALLFLRAYFYITVLDFTEILVFVVVDILAVIMTAEFDKYDIYDYEMDISIALILLMWGRISVNLAPNFFN